MKDDEATGKSFKWKAKIEIKSAKETKEEF